VEVRDGKGPFPWRIAFIAYASLLPLFAFDVFTPQLLAAEITYEIPVMLAAFTGDRKLTYRLLLCALLTNEVAAIIDAAADGFRWEIIGIENRALSIVSILIVAALTLAVQRASERLGRLRAQEAQRRRSVALSAAADHVLTSLSPEQIDATIVVEAGNVFAAQSVFWRPAGDGDCWELRDGRAVRCEATGVPPAVAALLCDSAESEGIEFFDLIAVTPHPVLKIQVREPATAAGSETHAAGALLILLNDAERAEETRLAAVTFRRLVLGALAQVRLTSDLVARNTSLSEKQGVIEGLIDAIAHDLRTPLAALSVTLQQSSDGAYGPLPAEYGEVLRESRTSIEDIRALAETLLLVARLESGAAPAHRNRVRLDVIAREVTAEFRALASSRSVDIVTRADAAAVTVADRAGLRRAVANLLANAIAHTPVRGTVELDVRHNGGSVDVVVADDGYGIDERLRPHLFERYAHGARIGSGTGLGLYIVRRVAEEAGGMIRYEPREPQGSTFTLSLPAAA
jgi:signal transduction histidine kinase